MGFHTLSTAKLKAKLNAISSDGYPATLAELNNYYPAVPVAENAGEIYNEAFLLFHNIEDKIFARNSGKNTGDKVPNTPAELFRNELIFIGNAPTPVPGERLSKASQVANQQFVDGNSEYLKKLTQAAQITNCRFPSDLDNGFIVNYDHLNKLVSSINSLAIATVLAAEAGDRVGVTENILTMLKICAVITAEPFALAYLVKMPRLSRTIQVLEYTLSMIKLDSSSLNRIQHTLELSLANNDQLLNQALAGSRVMNIEFKFIARNSENNVKYQITKLIGTVPTNKLKILNIYDALFALDKNDLNALNAYENKFLKQLQTISSIFFPINNLTIDPMDLFYKNLVMKAQINGAIIGLAIKQFQQKHHKLPQQLNQLVPEFIKILPKDPFCGKEFHYVVGDIELPLDKYDNNNYSGRHKSTKIVGYSRAPIYCIKRPGWMVYSCGRDQDDDNGVPMGFLKPALNGDITFRCVRRKPVKSFK